MIVGHPVRLRSGHVGWARVRSSPLRGPSASQIFPSKEKREKETKYTTINIILSTSIPKKTNWYDENNPACPITKTNINA